jgi:transposase
MLKLPADVKIFLASEPCDMRRQMDGLAALVRSGMNRDPESGDLYIFRNRRGDMVKALFVDRHGFCMLVKRLSKGTFRIEVTGAPTEGLELSAEELARLLSELSFTRRLPSFDT